MNVYHVYIHVHTYICVSKYKGQTYKTLPSLLPRLAILTLLNAGPDGLVVLALKCSSFSSVNRGTSGRSPICGLGNVAYKSVKEGNLMMSRHLKCSEKGLLVPCRFSCHQLR